LVRRKETTKKIKMANIDLTTGKIYGAVEGSKKYYHEVGHLKFEEECELGNFIRIWQDLSFKTLLFATALAYLSKFFILNFLIIICLLINIITDIYEEHWCNNYAKKIMRDKSDDRTTTNKNT